MHDLLAAWGLNVVVLALRVPSPWGGERLALPVMVRLHRKSRKGATEEEEEQPTGHRWSRRYRRRPPAPP